MATRIRKRRILERDRFLPTVAPEKGACRRRCIDVILENFPETEKLEVLSLPGPLPFTEMVLLQYRNAAFDLVERDTDVHASLTNALEYDFKNVGEHSQVFKMEMERFLEERAANPSDKLYHVVFLDLMGGWQRGYARMFELLNEQMADGGLVFFTYDVNWRWQSSPTIKENIPYPFSEVFLRMNFELLWFHEYTDTDNTNNRPVMQTVALQYRREKVGTVGSKYLKQSEVNELLASGWRPISEVLGISNIKAAYFTRTLNKRYPEVQGRKVCFTQGGNVRYKTLYSPEMQEKLIEAATQEGLFKKKRVLKKTYPRLVSASEGRALVQAGWLSFGQTLGFENPKVGAAIAGKIKNKYPDLVGTRASFYDSKIKNTRTYSLFSPEQQQQLIQAAKELGYTLDSKPIVQQESEETLNMEKLPEAAPYRAKGYLAANDILQSTQGDARTLGGIVRRMKSEDPTLSGVKTYDKDYGSYRHLYSPEEIEQIKRLARLPQYSDRVLIREAIPSTTPLKGETTEDFLNLKEAAALVKSTPGALSVLISKGKLLATKLGGEWKVKRKHLDAAHHAVPEVPEVRLVREETMSDTKQLYQVTYTRTRVEVFVNEVMACSEEEAKKLGTGADAHTVHHSMDLDEVVASSVQTKAKKTNLLLQ